MGTNIWSAVAALLFVLGLIPLSLWMLKAIRTYRPTIPGGIQIVQRTSLGPREQLALVRIADKTLLLGITPHSINTLTEIIGHDIPTEPNQNNAMANGQSVTPFQSLLNRFQKNAKPSR